MENQNNTFYRLSKKTIGNNFCSVNKELNNLYETVKSGNDFDPKRMESIIMRLQKIKLAAREFKTNEGKIDLRTMSKEYR